MTVMEDANIVAPVSSPATTRATTAPGLASVLGSGDHKVVGRIWIVAALIDGESTLKRLVHTKGRWYLRAENTAYPELIPRSDLVIQGAVQIVIRQLKG